MDELKGHWTTSASSPILFKKVDIFIPLEVYTCEVTACSISLATSIQLQRYMNFSFSCHFKKLRVLKMAATILADEFGTIHHYSSLEKNSEARLCSSLDTYKS